MSAVAVAAGRSTECLDLDRVTIDPKWALKLPAAYALRKRLLPLCHIDGLIVVAGMACPDDAARKVLEKHLGQACRYVQAEPGSLQRALERVYAQTALGDINFQQPAGNPRDEGDSAVAICDELFQAASLRGASDIHLIPDEQALAVHLRVDGILEPYRQLSKAVQPLVISRLKVLAGMDIAEKRSAQDGRILSTIGGSGRKLEVRAASLPTRHGERLTLRLLANSGSGLTFHRWVCASMILNNSRRPCSVLTG